MKIQKATLEDTQVIVSISQQEGGGGLTRPLTKAEVSKKILDADGAYVVVAKDKNAVVAYAVNTYAWGKLHLEEMAVEKGMRRKGIGTKILNRLVAHARKMKLGEVYLEVKTRNLAALSLYKRCGFQRRVFVPNIEGGFYGLYVPIRKSAADRQRADLQLPQAH